MGCWAKGDTKAWFLEMLSACPAFSWDWGLSWRYLTLEQGQQLVVKVLLLAQLEGKPRLVAHEFGFHAGAGEWMRFRTGSVPVTSIQWDEH